MSLSERKLVQGFVPVTGQVLSWIYVGFQANDITEWHWYREEWEGPLGQWTKISCERDFLEITEDLLGVRIMARVRLRSGVFITGIAWPVMSSQEMRALMSEAFRNGAVEIVTETKELKKLRNSIRLERELLKADKNFQDLVARNEQLLLERKKENKAIQKEREKIWEAGSIEDKFSEVERKLNEIEKRDSDLKKFQKRLRELSDSLQAKEANLRQLAERLMERELVFKDELTREFEVEKSALKTLEKRLSQEQQAFLADHSLQKQLDLLRAQLEEAENMWDVLAKANNLKLKFTTSAKAEIIRLVSKEVESEKSRRRAEARNSHSVFDSVSMCGSCGNIINGCSCF